MKKVFTIVIAMALLVSLLPATAAFAKPKGIDFDAPEITNMDNIHGQHYTLNIIGMKNPKNANMDYNGGHVIFVDIDGKSKIELVESGDPQDAPDVDPNEFAVLDKNATAGSPAVLALPDPGLDPYVVGEETTEDTITNYTIYVRALGSPQGNPYAKITTCAEVLESNLAGFLGAEAVNVLNAAAELGGVASIENTGQLMREKGHSIFTNQTAALLTMVLKVEIIVDSAVVDTVYVRVPIFDPILQGEYWEYDNHGLKHLQCFIYRVGTDVTTADDPNAWDLIPLP
jgi:hypothetical protein